MGWEKSYSTKASTNASTRAILDLRFHSTTRSTTKMSRRTSSMRMYAPEFTEWLSPLLAALDGWGGLTIKWTDNNKLLITH
jgi:hypothetical protein